MSPSDEERVLPHRLDAERAVLGAVLVNEAALPAVASVLQSGDFFRRIHQAIFTALLKLDAAKSHIDLVTVTAELDRTGWLHECGGPAYIAMLTDGVPRSAHAVNYAQLVREDARRRALIKLGTAMVDGAYDTERTSIELLDGIDKACVSMQQGRDHGRMIDLAVSAGAIYDDLSYRVEHQGQLLGLDTGFQTVNDITFGWQRGDMIVIAARPSIGKTAFVLNTAVAAAAHGKRVAIFSLEMRRQQLEYRILSHLSGVMLSRILTGRMSEADMNRVGDALAKMHELHIAIDDRGAQTIGDIRAGCRRLRAESGIDLVVVDYIQLMAGSLDRRGANRTEEMSDVSRRLKHLAYDVAVRLLVLSQINRNADTRADKRPLLSDLRETGSLEQDADNVCFLHRKNHRESGLTAFIAEKARNGPTGTAFLKLERDTQTFSDAPESEWPGAEKPPADEADETPRKRR